MRKIEQKKDRFIVDLSEGEYNALFRLTQIIPNYREGGITPDGIEISSLLQIIIYWLQGNFFLEALQLSLDNLKSLWHKSEEMPRYTLNSPKMCYNGQHHFKQADPAASEFCNCGVFVFGEVIR